MRKDSFIRTEETYGGEDCNVALEVWVLVADKEELVECFGGVGLHVDVVGLG